MPQEKHVELGNRHPEIGCPQAGDRVGEIRQSLAVRAVEETERSERVQPRAPGGGGGFSVIDEEQAIRDG